MDNSVKINIFEILIPDIFGRRKLLPYTGKFKIFF